MADLLCVLCISNRHPDDVRAAATIVGGLAVCYDEDDSEHYNVAWELLDERIRARIVRADAHAPDYIEPTEPDSDVDSIFDKPITLEELRPHWWRDEEK